VSGLSQILARSCIGHADPANMAEQTACFAAALRWNLIRPEDF
jgi:hypothetical protein